MNEMSLEEQIRCLEAMRTSLEDFCGIMQNVMDRFNNDIKSLRGQGFSVETEQTYQRDYYAPAKDDVDQVVSDIYHYHIDYLDRVINRLREVLNEH